MDNSVIFLVGPMGVGKSTIGRALAADLHLGFRDSDRVIEDRTGADIPWIFDMEGEEGFRDRESAVLTELCGENNVVIATGGGIVLRAENRAEMKVSGFVVNLTASIEQLVERTTRAKKRPLLQVENPRQKIIELLEFRDPLYRDVAHVLVSTERRSPKTVVQEIISRYKEFSV